MLIHPDRSCLLVIDIQERLAPAIDQSESLVSNCCWLLDVANRLHIPVIATEQYPRGLGATAEAIASRIPAEQIFEKIHFSAVNDPSPGSALVALKPDQVIIIGMESHVCVLQSAMELKQQAREVFVVEDCVGSRTAADKAAALTRMRQCGIQVVTREMVAFEWLRKAGDDRFRNISREFLR